jgi:hypothetical protein
VTDDDDATPHTLEGVLEQQQNLPALANFWNMCTLREGVTAVQIVCGHCGSRKVGEIRAFHQHKAFASWSESRDDWRLDRVQLARGFQEEGYTEDEVQVLVKDTVREHDSYKSHGRRLQPEPLAQCVVLIFGDVLIVYPGIQIPFWCRKHSCMYPNVGLLNLAIARWARKPYRPVPVSVYRPGSGWRAD